MVEPLYKTNVTCAYCGNRFSTSRIRPSFKKAYKTDTDFCMHYKPTFLIGELNRRLKHDGEALKWFARIINDKKIMDAGIIRASREAWKTVREDMAARNMEIPQESQIT
jgi:hypothetical protein